MKDCLGCNSGFHEGHFFLLTLLKFLQQSQVVYRHLPATGLNFLFVKVAKLNRYTYKGPSEKSLFFHEAFGKSTTPSAHYFIKLTLLKNISSVITKVTLLMSVFHFYNLVSFGPQKFGMMCCTSKHWVAHNHTLHSGHLNFILVFWCLEEHTWHQILFLSKGQFLLCLVSSLFNVLLVGAVSLVFCSEFEVLFPSLVLPPTPMSV